METSINGDDEKERLAIRDMGFSTRAGLALLVMAFVLSSSIMVLMALNFPELNE